MTSNQFNNQRQNMKRELIYPNNEYFEKKKKRNVISSKTTGIIYAIESINNKFVETIENQESANQKPEKIMIDEPSPEGLGEFFEERKKIIFGNLMKNDHLIGQFITKTQKNLIEKTKNKISFIFEKTVDIYDTMICLKETIANYCLVIKLYLFRNNYNKALELFLLMVQKNKKLFQYIYKKIKEQFPKVTNANRIGKFFPLIIRKYVEVLSCLVKLSDKFNKPQIHNMFMQLYIKTFFIVSKTGESKFGLISNGNFLKSDIKNISKYLYANIFFDIGIFYFLKYHSFLFIIKILEHVLDLYKNNISNELLLVEKVLLLKTNYNLGLFLFTNGQSYESIYYITKAKNILTTINLIPLTRELKSRGGRTNHKKGKFKSKSLLSNLSYNNKTTSYIIKEENKNNKEFKTNSKNNNSRKTGILFVNQMNGLDNQFENVEEKIYNEIELISAEIEFSLNGDKKAFEHINKLLKTNNSRKRSGYSKLIHEISQIKKEKEQEKGKEKEKDENFCNYRLLNDFDKRKMMHILNKIEDKYKHRNNSMDKIYKNENHNYKTSRKYYHSKEMEKFFLFICGLSEYQLKILNESQPKDTILRNNLPIIITNQFKDCLTNSQRMDLTLLESMSLSRYLILLNPNEDICIENLDYLFMKYNIKNLKEERKNTNADIINHKNNLKVNRTYHQRNKKRFFGFQYPRTNYRGDKADDKEKIKFDKMLDDIMNDKNMEFIEIFRESIVNVLINLNNDEKELLINSKTFLKDLVKKMEKSMIIHKK